MQRSVLFAFLTLGFSAIAQPQPAATIPSAVAPSRAAPRIALALSGGGARGFAHIGVLKVLEEMRIPIACVTGTSMGSIVGGGYAAGRSPAELERIAKNTDWNDLFADAPPRGEISPRRKADDYKNFFSPEFGFRDGGLALPKGVIIGLSIDNFLRYMTVGARAVSDFDQLPIPFRAVAADIETGTAVVLASGSLSNAMRSSMAIPGAVAPVEINGRLLVDGGIANNLPIDVARELCGDVVIAVSIGTPAMKRDEITSALSVVGQLINFLGKANVDRQIASMKPTDILISPELGDISSGNFERSEAAIEIGERAARVVADKLALLSISADAYAELQRERRRERIALGVVDEIRFEGVVRTNPDVLRRLIDSKAGEPLSQRTLAADRRRLYGRGDFEQVDYRYLEERGRRVLVFDVVEKETGPDYLRIGLGLASDLRSESYFNLLLGYRKTWMNRLGGEWYTEAQIGRNSYL